MMDSPTANRTETVRENNGRFKIGTRGGPGNPHAGKVETLRQKLFEIVTPDRFGKVIEALLNRGEAGDVHACKEIMLRTLGSPLQADLLARIDELEESMRRTGKLVHKAGGEPQSA